MMNNPIERNKNIDITPVYRGKVNPGPLRKASGPDEDIAELAISDKSLFKRFSGGLKRTFAGRNRAGKILTHGLVAAIGVATGLNIQPLFGLINQQPLNQPTMFDLNILSFILMIVFAGLGYLVKHFKTKSLAQDITRDVQQIVGKIRQARDPESEAGTKVTDNEKQVILRDAETQGLELIKRLFRQFFGDRSDTQANS